MHCNLTSPDATPVFFRFNYGAMPSLKSLNFILPYYSVSAADTLLYTVTWTYDLYHEHLQCIACDVMKLCTKFERNRAIRGGVTAISIFDLMTLNAV